MIVKESVSDEGTNRLMSFYLFKPFPLIVMTALMFCILYPMIVIYHVIVNKEESGGCRILSNESWSWTLKEVFYQNFIFSNAN